MANDEVDGDVDATVRDAQVGVRIRAHPSLCEGWGNCHRWAPDVYPLDEHGHIDIHLVDVPPDRVADAELGARACQAQALSVIRPGRPAVATGG